MPGLPPGEVMGRAYLLGGDGAGLPIGVGDTGHPACVALVQPAVGQRLLDVGPLHGVRLQQ